MAIGYIKKRQKLVSKGTVSEAYLAKVSYGNYVNSELLAAEVSKRSSVSAATVMLVLREVEECMSGHLAAGDVVKLDSIGTFAPTITAKAQDSPKKVNQFSITKTGVLFRPTKRLKDVIKDAGVKLVDKKVYNADPHPNTKKTQENSDNE
ncbi:MAG: HU family DNA-binding protein [Bacteroidales bacterium]|nr:HU family DNA-binding protein [Bacteroidales bacterium]